MRTTSGVFEYTIYYGKNRSSFKVGDSLQLFTPSPTITVDDACTLTTIEGGEVEFERLNINLVDKANIISKASRLIFKGCIIDRDDVNASGENLEEGPITAIVTLSGCISTNTAEDSGCFTPSIDRISEQVRILNSKFSGGTLFNTNYFGGSNLLIAGSYLETYITCSFGKCHITHSRYTAGGGNFDISVDINIDQCTFDNRITLRRNQVYILDTSIGGLFLIRANCTLSNTTIEGSDVNGQLTARASTIDVVTAPTITCNPAALYGVHLTNSKMHIDSQINVNGSTSAAFYLQHNSSLSFRGASNASNLTNTGNGIVLLSGSNLTYTNTPYTGTFSSGAGTAVKVGDNAATSFATITTGLAADVNDYGTASPQMCFAVKH